MLVRVIPQQQAQSGNQPNQDATARAQRADRSQRTGDAGRTGPPSGDEIRQQIQNALRAVDEATANQQEAQAAAAAAREAANQVRIRNGLPVIAGPPGTAQIEVHRGPQNMIPPQVVDISLGFFAMCAAMVIGWPLARAFGRRLERGGQAPAVPAAMQDQLQRIEQAVDAMSIEIERISESQRYLAKLQSGARSEALPR